jgi:para-aminobenzoate synthetase/4-amino-4-deoxychorismate lyase
VIDYEPVDSHDGTLSQKTSDRSRYDARAARHPDADDVVLVNESGEITKTVRANVAVHCARQWLP